MFDEHKNSNPEPPADQPQENKPDLTGHPIMDQPTALESGRLSENTTPKPPPEATVEPAAVEGPVLTPKKSHKKLWTIVGVLVVVGLIVLAVWVYLLNRPEAIGEDVDSDSSSQQDDSAVQPAEVVAADTDKDGLDDAREREVGTSPTLADTDSDGLTDNEEVTLWNTDPLDPDTDKDGYSDGDEIDNNYNPTGPGTLFDINDIDI